MIALSLGKSLPTPLRFQDDIVAKSGMRLKCLAGKHRSILRDCMPAGAPATGLAACSEPEQTASAAVELTSAATQEQTDTCAN
jgi:hypothetical protein